MRIVTLLLFFLFFRSLWSMEGWLTTGAGYFRPDAQQWRETFGSFWFTAHGEAALAFREDKGYFFADVDYIWKQRHLSHIALLPLSVGLKWICPIVPRLDLSLSAAPRYTFLWMKKQARRGAWGAMAGLGLSLQPSSHLFFDVSATYGFAQFSGPLRLWAGGISGIAEAGWLF